MTPYYSDDLVTIYHGDCREWMPEADVIMTDPPYGIGWADWDHERPDIASIIGSRPALVWGGNYYADQLPVSESWFIWVKRPVVGFDNDPRTYATVEMAWSDFGGKPRIRNHVWDGGKRAGDSSNRKFLHPTQKPLEIMRWCVSESPKGTILDPFMGSGTTLRAAKDLGRRAIGIEIEERYCEIAAQRCRQEVLGLAG